MRGVEGGVVWVWFLSLRSAVQKDQYTSENRKIRWQKNHSTPHTDQDTRSYDNRETESRKHRPRIRAETTITTPEFFSFWPLFILEMNISFLDGCVIGTRSLGETYLSVYLSVCLSVPFIWPCLLLFLFS